MNLKRLVYRSFERLDNLKVCAIANVSFQLQVPRTIIFLIRFAFRVNFSRGNNLEFILIFLKKLNLIVKSIEGKFSIWIPKEFKKFHAILQFYKILQCNYQYKNFM